MLRQSLFAAAACGLSALGASATVVTFEELTPDRPYANGGSYSNIGSFSSGGAQFNNSYTDWGGGFESWFGWAYSNTTDSSTPGHLNFSAITGGGSDGSGGVSPGSNYLVASEDNYTPLAPTITFAPGQYATSLRITNTAYAYHSMLNGDSFAKKFGGAGGDDPDWFKLTISGFTSDFAATGTIEFYLADFRFADNSLDYIIGQWTLVDLSPLGSSTSILQFNLSSSDYSFGTMNTPASFAIDDINVVPEPSTCLLAAFGLGSLFLARNRIRRS